MRELQQHELKMIKGKGWNWGITLLIGSIITVAVGIFDGFFRPYRCQ